MLPTSVTKAYAFTTAYVSTFGGTCTIIGTGTNLAFKGIYEDHYKGGRGISFSDWFI